MVQNKNYMFNKLIPHIGHSIEVVGYAAGTNGMYATLDLRDYQNVAIECLDCNEVLIDYDKEE